MRGGEARRKSARMARSKSHRTDLGCDARTVPRVLGRGAPARARRSSSTASLGFTSIPVGDTLPRPLSRVLRRPRRDRPPRSRAAGSAPHVRAARDFATTRGALRRLGIELDQRAPARQRVPPRRLQRPGRADDRADRGAHVPARRMEQAERRGVRRVLRATACRPATARASSALLAVVRLRARRAAARRRTVAAARRARPHDRPARDALRAGAELPRDRISTRASSICAPKGIAARTRDTARGSRATVGDARRRPKARSSTYSRKARSKRARQARCARWTSASASRKRACSGLQRGKCVSRYSIWSASTRRPFR